MSDEPQRAWWRLRSPKTIVEMRAHSLRRARERYGIHLSHDHYAELVAQIHRGQARMVRKQSNTRTWWIVRQQDTEMLAVYENVRHAISTFLAMDALDNPKQKVRD